jgi:hypothetical protein
MSKWSRCSDGFGKCKSFGEGMSERVVVGVR